MSGIRAMLSNQITPTLPSVETQLHGPRTLGRPINENQDRWVTEYRRRHARTSQQAQFYFRSASGCLQTTPASLNVVTAQALYRIFQSLPID
jgi:hypothetical protein